jgi:hypothetical protein
LNANQEVALIGNISSQLNHGLQGMDHQHHIPSDPMLHQSDEVHDTNSKDLAQIDGLMNHHTNVENQCQMDGMPSLDSLNETTGRHTRHIRMGVEKNAEYEGMRATTIVEEELERRFSHNAFEEAFKVPLYEGSTLSSLCV